MKTDTMRSVVLRVLGFAAAALFSTIALAVSMTWQFGGSDDDGRSFSALMTFDSTSTPTRTFTDTLTIGGTGTIYPITDTITTLIREYPFSGLSFNLGGILGSTGAGSIMQAELLFPSTISNTTFISPYSVQGRFDGGSGRTISDTLTLGFYGMDLFGSSLLTDVSALRGSLPGVFELTSSDVITATLASSLSTITGTIDSVSDLTSIPEPWTLGLMLSGLGSIGFLSRMALRSRRGQV